MLAASKDRDSNVFPRVAREGRKFKVGLCAVTQQPKLLDGELLSQFNTFFILGLADEKDRTILRSSSKQDIAALGPGDPDPHARRVPAGQPRRPLRRAGQDPPLGRRGPQLPAPAGAPSAWSPPTCRRWSTDARRGPGRRPPRALVLLVHDARRLQPARARLRGVLHPGGGAGAGPVARPAGVAGRHLRPPPAHVPLLPHRPEGARAHPRARHATRAHHRQPRHAPAARAPAAPTPPWPTSSPSSTSPTAWPTSGSPSRASSSTPCPRC